jgi:aminoglycoside phosphotransferase (APT) family kinase protein
MKPPGRLLAAGRDADIFEYAPGLVLRRSRDGRSMIQEARTMTYLRENRYPVPAVEQVSDDGLDLVMERIEGLSMVDAVAKAPWTVRRQARTLAELHIQLHDIIAPDFLPQAPVGIGTKVLHMDLHPLNVIVGPKGSCVIDWTGASAGDPAVDVALAWVLMSAGQIPATGIMVMLLSLGRALLVKAFVSHFDRTEVSEKLREAVEWKAKDPHMSDAEVTGMWKVVEHAEARH